MIKKEDFLVGKRELFFLVPLFFLWGLVVCAGCKQDLPYKGVVRVGINYPATGQLVVSGEGEVAAVRMAANEINARGGILGHRIELITRNDMANARLTALNAREMIEEQEIKLLIQTISSACGIAAGRIAQETGTVFMGVGTYAPSLTCEDGNRHTFRPGWNSHMQAKAVASYLNRQFRGKEYFYITFDYIWGWSTEEVYRKFTATEDTALNQGYLLPFPETSPEEVEKALDLVEESEADVIVLIVFGDSFYQLLQGIYTRGLKDKRQIVLALFSNPAEMKDYGYELFEDIILPVYFCWQVPYKYEYARGKQFVEEFMRLRGTLPHQEEAACYTAMIEYASAVERAGSFEAARVIKALEGHRFQLTKDEQYWRDFDHQAVQTVYVTKINKAEKIRRSYQEAEYFEILKSYRGEELVRSRKEWNLTREKAGKPDHYEPLPGEEGYEEGIVY